MRLSWWYKTTSVHSFYAVPYEFYGAPHKKHSRDRKRQHHKFGGFGLAPKVVKHHYVIHDHYGPQISCARPDEPLSCNWETRLNVSASNQESRVQKSEDRKITPGQTQCPWQWPASVSLQKRCWPVPCEQSEMTHKTCASFIAQLFLQLFQYFPRRIGARTPS
jgi:hypothetical protein